MAGAVVSSLVLKIGAILADEATKSVIAMKEFMKDMSEIKVEFERQQSFLRTVERQKEKDANEKIFIKQIRELAFDIEDIIDEFTYKLGEEQGEVLHTLIKRAQLFDASLQLLIESSGTLPSSRSVGWGDSGTIQ